MGLFELVMLVLVILWLLGVLVPIGGSLIHGLLVIILVLGIIRLWPGAKRW